MTTYDQAALERVVALESDVAELRLALAVAREEAGIAWARVADYKRDCATLMVRAGEAERERDDLRVRLASLEETVTAAEFWSGP